MLVLDKKVYPFYGMGRRSEIWGIYDDAGSKGGLRRVRGAPEGWSKKYLSFFKRSPCEKKISPLVLKSTERGQILSTRRFGGLGAFLGVF